MSLRFECSPTTYAVRVYDQEGHPDNYVASAQIRTYGDRGWMSSINGKRFYEALATHVPELLAAAHCKTLEGYVTKAHARLMRMAGHGKFGIYIDHTGLCAGRQMEWVVITALGVDATGIPDDILRPEFKACLFRRATDL